MQQYIFCFLLSLFISVLDSLVFYWSLFLSVCQVTCWCVCDTVLSKQVCLDHRHPWYVWYVCVYYALFSIICTIMWYQWTFCIGAGLFSLFITNWPNELQGLHHFFSGKLVYDRIKLKAQYIPKGSSVPVQLPGEPHCGKFKMSRAWKKFRPANPMFYWHLNTVETYLSY